MLCELLEFALANDKKSYQELGVGIVLVAFCGVRATEVRRLLRCHIVEENGIDGARWSVRVPKHLAKWGHKRTIEIPNNAIEWLRAFRATGFDFDDSPIAVSEKTGKPLSEEGQKSRFSRFFEAFKKNAKDFPKYEQNGFRVSFGSYGAKILGVEKVCEMMGEKRPQTFWQHYREDADTNEARHYFAIIPKKRRLQKIRGQFHKTFGIDWKRKLLVLPKEEWSDLCGLSDEEAFPLLDEEIEEAVETASLYEKTEEISFTLTK